MSLVIAGLQHPGHPGDVAANLVILSAAAEHAKARGAELLLTPEMFVTGYNIGDQVAALADPALVDRMSRIAAANGIAIVAGLPEPLPSGGVANTAVFVDDRGTEVTRYRKTHLLADLDRGLFVAERLVPVRAWENQVYVAYVNRTGEEGDLRYVGRSSIVAPSGEVRSALGPDEPQGLLIATVDADVVARARLANPYLDDLRPDLY